MSKNCAVILAAGEGTRMKSLKPKALTEVLFKPMIDWVTDCVRQSGIEDICVITGHMGDMLQNYLSDDILTRTQEERLGTGHAVIQAKDFISAHFGGNVLILNGDAPFVDKKTVCDALDFHKQNKNSATVITAKIADPTGYGRIIRDKKNALSKIVEQKEANDEEIVIDEVNSGAYWFDCEQLIKALDELVQERVNADMQKDYYEDILKVNYSPVKKEYYLTDAIEIIKNMKKKVDAFKAEKPEIVLGANDRIQLLELNTLARMQVLRKHMQNGVSIPCADGIIISPDTQIGRDTVILPGTMIKGETLIGTCCTIGSNSVIEDCIIGDNTVIDNSHCYHSSIAGNCEIGPFVRIRPGCVIKNDCRVGNFVELKNSNVDSETKISHLSYIGDSDVGSDVNIGCGCATVNFNGVDKNRTVIGNGAFIGCGTNLVAPVELGTDSYIAAGSTIVDDVPDHSLAIARNRQVIKADWVKKKKPYRRMR